MIIICLSSLMLKTTHLFATEHIFFENIPQPQASNAVDIRQRGFVIVLEKFRLFVVSYVKKQFHFSVTLSSLDFLVKFYSNCVPI